MANLTKFARVLKDAEDKAAANAAALKDEFNSLSSELPALKAKASDIEDGLSSEEDVKARIRKGEPLTGLDLVTARADDEIALMRHSHVKSRLDFLKRSLPVGHTLLADHVAPVFEGFVPAEVLVTNVPAKEWRKDVPVGTHALVLVQTNKVERDAWTQTYSGEVEAQYVRNGMMKPIPVDALEKAARSKRVGMRVISNEPGDGGSTWVTMASGGSHTEDNEFDPQTPVVDRLRIEVRHVLDGLPVIQKVEGSELSSILKGACYDLMAEHGRGRITTSKPSMNDSKAEGHAWTTSFGIGVSVNASKPKVTEAAEGNQRVATYTQTLNLSSINVPDFVEEMNKRLEPLVGLSLRGIGVVESFKVTPKIGKMPENHPVEVQVVCRSLSA